MEEKGWGAMGAYGYPISWGRFADMHVDEGVESGERAFSKVRKLGRHRLYMKGESR